MEHNDTKYILKKLMQDALAEQEQAALNDQDAVKRHMTGQWDRSGTRSVRGFGIKPLTIDIYIIKYIV